MFCKLALSNIKKSFKDYTIYFVTLVLGVCIFYIFNSINSQTIKLEVSSSENEIINNIEKVLSYLSIFIAVVLGCLIIYASRFFIKKRNKEFGIYMTLGMSKRKIATILLVETFFIGLLSLVVGSLIGVGLSQVTSIFVANMFEADMSKYTFVFSKEAMKRTIINFGIIYVVVMIFNTIIINKQKLIDLINRSKKQEKISFKNSIICRILFIISIGMLTTAYYYFLKKPEQIFDYENHSMLIPMLIIFLVVGTIMFFYSLATMLLKILSKCHRFYSNKLNIFVLKQVSSKFNTMVVSMSIICIMLAVALCSLSISVTIKNYYNFSVEKYAPADFQLGEAGEVICQSYGEYYSDTVDSEVNEQNGDLQKFIDSDDVIKNNTKDITIINIYNNSDVVHKKIFPEYADELEESYMMRIIGEGDYNKMAKLYKIDKVELEENEYAIVANKGMNTYKKIVDSNNTINIFGKDLKPYKKVIDGFFEMCKEPSEEGFIVVKDSIIKNDSEYTQAQMLLGNYSTMDKKTIELIEKKISMLAIGKHTKKGLKDSAVGESLKWTFVSLYLGIIFLISSAAILALKEVSDCFDDKDKYKTLRQIGADEKDVKKALFKQTLIFFMMPLALASLHSLFMLKYCTYILNFIGIKNIISSTLATFVFLIVIYGLYFIVTYICNKNIIKEKI